MSIFLAILTGTGLGYLIERGNFCFHSTLRGLFRMPQQLDLFRAYLLSLLIAVPLVNGMIVLGWIEPWIAPFAWRANIVGGLIFGVGMVVASTCITGLFYKLGHGMLGTLVGLATWAIGDLVVYRGPLAALREALNASPIMVDGADGQSATVLKLFGPAGWLLLIGLAMAIAIYLWRSPRPERARYWSWLPLGAAVGLFTSLAWLLADAGGSNYTFGTSRVPTTLFEALTTGATGIQAWIPVSLVSLVLGAFLAALTSQTLWVRGETGRRYAELAVGGLLMGIGAAFAGGCNLGHSLVGVPLLSLGSISTTLSMAVGLFFAHSAYQLPILQRSSQNMEK